MGQLMKSPVAIGVAVLAAALVAFLLTGFNMHRGFALFAAVPMMLLGVAFWVAIIAGGLYLAKQLGVFEAISESSRDKALSLLRQCYAKGEISRAEYFQMRQDLEA